MAPKRNDAASAWTPVDESAWQPVADTPNPANVAGAGPMGLPQPASPSANMQPSTIGAAVPYMQTAADVGKGAVKGALSTVNGVSSLINKIPVVGNALAPSSGIRAAQLYAQPQNTAQTVGKVGEQAAEFMLPGPAEEAAALRLAPKVGKFAPLVRAGLAGLGSGAVNKAQGGNFGTGAMAGAAGSGIGQGVRAIAPLLAESALRVTGNDRLYGRTVGDAILQDTKGIRPNVVEQSARDTISALKPQVENAAAQASTNGVRGSLASARATVDGVINKHTVNRAVNSAQELSPLQSFLQRDPVTGMPLSASQSPTGLLQMKRGLDSDFIGNWNPTRNSNNQLNTAKSVYGTLADEFHAVTPGAAEADQRISSLIPVTDRASRAARGAGVLESTMNRFRTPTGALIGSATGGAEAYRQTHSVPGALAGAAAGAVLPSLFASPTTQMLAARTAYQAVPRMMSPVVGALLGRSRLYGKPDGTQ